jgi:hypothetical protein
MTRCAEFIRFARRQGWTVTLTGSGHLRLSRPDARTVFAPSTPSDWRSWHNVQRDMRRALTRETRQ